ncbi:hypothetical protein BIW11_09587 [Tropilaelaps mercedesae]|uniref:Uncharacterized protein n=1 Tax=Tropilaelaps mercedesae TaxID=418985 RepID=A0A1V9XJH1_9ACAR|nr:hypothetical protein BIW11_09587 [Tropilaelaps mercedesae]
MEDSMCSSFASVYMENEITQGVEFKSLPKGEYFVDDELKLHFEFFHDPHCPSYLDVVCIVPVSTGSEEEGTSNEISGDCFRRALTQMAMRKHGEDIETFSSLMPTGALMFSYCNWKVESGAGLFSVSTKVDTLVEKNKNLSSKGAMYVAQYISPYRSRPVAESEEFRIYPISEESMIELPGVFSDDGLIVLGSGSDAEESELTENNDLGDASSQLGSSSGEAKTEDLAIVMSATELRKMEDDQRTSNDKLRALFDQYKGDLMELTRGNETLKQRLQSEHVKVEGLLRGRDQLLDEINEAKRVMTHQQTLFQKALSERERQLREEQKKVMKFEEENSLINEHLENLRCCVDAHLETKNILVKEIDRLKNENEEMAKEIKALKEVQKMDRASETDTVIEVKAEKTGAVQNNHSCDLEQRVQDLVGRLQSAKLEYISLYKENKRKEKALENICNWASLAKDGMSLEAPAPTQVPSLVSLTRSKFSTSSATLNSSGLPSSNNPPFVGLKTKENKDGQALVEEDLIELGSDSGRLSLPPRQKRKIELVRRTASSTAATAGVSSGAALRALRGKMLARGRHRGQEAIRTLKRDVSALEQDSGSVTREQQQSPSQTLQQQQSVVQQSSPLDQAQQQSDQLPVVLSPSSLPASSSLTKPTPAPPRFKMSSKKKESSIPKPSAPEEPANSSASAAARGTNTYSAAGLISDLETDASNTEEETSAINPHICPLCVTSIADYEAHMREAHQKQPCPICGYVFDTNIPVYVMTYHVERHLEEDNADGPTTAPK